MWGLQKSEQAVKKTRISLAEPQNLFTKNLSTQAKDKTLLTVKIKTIFDLAQNTSQFELM